MNREFLSRGRWLAAETNTSQDLDPPPSKRRTAEPLRSGLALFSALAVAGLGLSAPLLGGPVVAHAVSEQRIVVTDGSDQVGGTPVPGTLRAAVAEIAEDSSQAAAGSVAYVVEFAAAVETVSLEDDLQIEVGQGAHSVRFEGAGENQATLALGEYSVAFDGDELPGEMALVNMEIASGADGAGWYDLAANTHRFTNTTLRDVGYLGVASRSGDTFENVVVENVYLLLDPVSGDTDEYDLAIDSSEFDTSSLLVNPSAGLRNSVSVTDSTMTGSEDGPALSVNIADETSSGPSDVVIAGTQIFDNPNGGVTLRSVNAVSVTTSYFSGNGHESSLNLDMAELGESWTSVTDSEFTENLGNFAAIKIGHFVESVYIAGNRIVGNDTTDFSGMGAGILIDARNRSADGVPQGLVSGAAAAGAVPPAELIPGEILIERNEITGNSSLSEAAGVHVSGFLESGDNPIVTIRENAFSGNSAMEAAGDVSATMVGSFDGAQSSLLLHRNTFEDSEGTDWAGSEYAGRSVGVMNLGGSTFESVNNTFVGGDTGQPMIGFETVTEGSNVDIVHNTFSGGGLSLGPDMPVNADTVRVAATVFDSSTDPVFASEDSSPVATLDVVTRTTSEYLEGVAATPQEEMKLGELADNGGFTKTMLPALGSKLIDAVTEGTTYVDTDQRGIVRPQGARSDVGAVEVESDVMVLEKDITVVEGEDAVVKVLRSGPMAGEGSATLTAADGSAKLDEDYSLESGDVSFAAAADVAELVFPTVDRSGLQGEREFTVTVSDPSAGAVLGDVVSVTVTIVDKDEPVGPNPDPGDDGEGPTPGPGDTGKLPATGSGSNAGLFVGAGLALALGAVLLTRRRLNADS